MPVIEVSKRASECCAGEFDSCAHQSSSLTSVSRHQALPSQQACSKGSVSATPLTFFVLQVEGGHVSIAPNDFNTNWVQTLNLCPSMSLGHGESLPVRWGQISLSVLSVAPTLPRLINGVVSGFSLRRPV